MNHCIVYLVVMSKPVNQLVSERKRQAMQGGTRGRGPGGDTFCVFKGCSVVFIQCYCSTIDSSVTSVRSPTCPTVIPSKMTSVSVESTL